MTDIDRENQVNRLIESKRYDEAKNLLMEYISDVNFVEAEDENSIHFSFENYAEFAVYYSIIGSSKNYVPVSTKMHKWYFFLGLIEENKGNYKDAIDYFDLSKKWNPVHIDTLLERADNFYKLGDSDRFRAEIEKAHKYIYSKKDLAKYYREQGWYFSEKESYIIANGLYSKSNQYEPNNKTTENEIQYIANKIRKRPEYTDNDVIEMILDDYNIPSGFDKRIIAAFKMDLQNKKDNNFPEAQIKYLTDIVNELTDNVLEKEQKTIEVGEHKLEEPVQEEVVEEPVVEQPAHQDVVLPGMDEVEATEEPVIEEEEEDTGTPFNSTQIKKMREEVNEDIMIINTPYEKLLDKIKEELLNMTDITVLGQLLRRYADTTIPTVNREDIFWMDSAKRVLQNIIISIIFDGQEINKETIINSVKDLNTAEDLMNRNSEKIAKDQRLGYLISSLNSAKNILVKDLNIINNAYETNVVVGEDEEENNEEPKKKVEIVFEESGKGSTTIIKDDLQIATEEYVKNKNKLNDKVVKAVRNYSDTKMNVSVTDPFFLESSKRILELLMYSLLFKKQEITEEDIKEYLESEKSIKDIIKANEERINIEARLGYLKTYMKIANDENMLFDVIKTIKTNIK